MLVVWKLDRLSRSLFDLVNLMQTLQGLEVGLKALTGHGAMVDTTRPEGRFIFCIFAALAEFERELISEHTKAGIAAARRRGQHMGRPAKLTPHQIDHARALMLHIIAQGVLLPLCLPSPPTLCFLLNLFFVFHLYVILIEGTLSKLGFVSISNDVERFGFGSGWNAFR